MNCLCSINTHGFHLTKANAVAGYSYTAGTVMPLPSTGTTGVNTRTLTSASTTISGITGTLAFMNGTCEFIK